MTVFELNLPFLGKGVRRVTEFCDARSCGESVQGTRTLVLGI